MSHSVRVLICGTGSAAHVLAGILSTKPDVDVQVLTRSADKARRWTSIMHDDSLRVTKRTGLDERVAVTANPFIVTSEPRQAARGCDVIIFAIPAFLHWHYLTLLEPYIHDGCVLVGLPGQNGFEFDVRQVLGPRLQHCLLINFESLPWVCRIGEFGKTVGILGTKDRLVGAMEGDLSRACVRDPVTFMQHLFGEPPTLVVTGHLLGITLRSPNACSHPPIMYGRWKDWDEKPLDQPPLFYQGVDEETADLLGTVSAEVVETSQRIMACYPHVDLSQVISMYDWDIGCYGSDIKDKTNLMTALRTNSGYEGITHPMIQTRDGTFVPDFGHRFLAEDVPFGLVVIRGIAEMAGVRTPAIDTVLSWCQQRLGKDYLVGSTMTGKDLATTRCPQRYGLRTIADVLWPDWIRAFASGQ